MILYHTGGAGVWRGAKLYYMILECILTLCEPYMIILGGHVQSWHDIVLVLFGFLQGLSCPVDGLTLLLVISFTYLK